MIQGGFGSQFSVLSFGLRRVLLVISFNRRVRDCLARPSPHNLSFRAKRGIRCLPATPRTLGPALYLKQFVIPSKARNPLFASDTTNAWPALYLKQLVILSKARNPLFAGDGTGARPALYLKQLVIPSKARNALFASDATNARPALYLKQLVIPSKARNPLFAGDATDARPALPLKQLVIPSKARNPLFASATNACPFTSFKRLHPQTDN